MQKVRKAVRGRSIPIKDPNIGKAYFAVFNERDCVEHPVCMIRLNYLCKVSLAETCCQLVLYKLN